MRDLQPFFGAQHRVVHALREYDTFSATSWQGWAVSIFATGEIRAFVAVFVPGNDHADDDGSEVLESVRRGSGGFLQLLEPILGWFYSGCGGQCRRCGGGLDSSVPWGMGSGSGGGSTPVASVTLGPVMAHPAPAGAKIALPEPPHPEGAAAGPAGDHLPHNRYAA